MARHLPLVPLLVTALALPAWALLSGEYRSADQIAKARNLLIVRYPQQPPNMEHLIGMGGLIDYRVEVLRVLAGTGAEPGKEAEVSTTTCLRPGARYLLAGEEAKRGGKPLLLFHWSLGVVEIPDEFNLNTLAGKPVKEQVTAILKARAAQLDRVLESLRTEKERLDKALAGDKAPPRKAD